MMFAIEIRQEKTMMFLTKMKIGELIKQSIIPHYNSENDKDYQRAPIPTHYRKIAKYFMTEQNPVLPSAIIAAMGEDDFTYNNGELELKNKIRIVDGQHRIEGIKCLNEGYAKNSNEKYKKLEKTYDLPLIIMVIEEKNILTEIDAFINLNSKGKKVRTDLAEALKNQKTRRKLEVDKLIVEDDGVIKMISMEIIKALNNRNESKWKGMIIQADENGNRREQPISLLAFTRSVQPIVSTYFSKMKIDSIDRMQAEQVVNDIVELVLGVWDIVIDKWPECFTREEKYNELFNICKGIGVNTLFGVFEECYSKNNAHNYESLNQFREIINKSKISYEDWLVGGTFTGFASAQGFMLIKQFIKGEKDLEDLRWDIL